MNLAFMPAKALLLVRTPQGYTTVDHTTPKPPLNHLRSQLFKAALPLQGGRVLLQTPTGRLSIYEPESERAQEIPGTSGRERCAVGDEGRIVVLADQDEHRLEWLRPFHDTQEPQEHASSTSWLAMRPSTRLGAWFGIDAQGVIRETGASGTPRELWRLQDAAPRIAALSADATHVIYDDNSGPGMLSAKQGQPPVRHLWGKASAMALSDDGRIAALGFPSGRVALFDLESGQELLNEAWNRGAISSLAFVDAERLAFAASGQIRVWEWRKGGLLPHSLDFPGTITAMAADPAGQRIAFATSEGALHLLHTASGLRVNGQFSAASDTTCLLWDESDGSIWSFASSSTAQRCEVPPLLPKAPQWLPDYAEQFIGMKVDASGRVVRLRASNPATLPTDGDETLKAWLMR